MTAPASFDLIGVGAPIMDVLARVPEDFLTTISGAKGGMEMVDAAQMHEMVERLPERPTLIPGGSAANTVLGATRLGLRTTFLGKRGSDAISEAYLSHFLHVGGDAGRFKQAGLPHARCLSLITPDAQRTMRTCLSAAMTLAPEEISPEDFVGCRHAHLEGYLLFNPDLANAVINAARSAGCTISLDLASFEVVNAARSWIFSQLDLGIDTVFANEDEIHALFQSKDTYDSLALALAARGTLAAVKMGKDGAWIALGTLLHRVEPLKVAQPVDTTGAGDAWAAGFLYGRLRGRPLPECGALGSLLGAETVQHIGPSIPEIRWDDLRNRASALPN
jgi:sugar/nucleoside kinase (ribokinase family)